MPTSEMTIRLPMILCLAAAASGCWGQRGSAGVYDGPIPMIDPPVHGNPTSQGDLGPGVPVGFWVRPGFRVSVAVPRIEDARFMAFDDKGRLYVSRPDHGDVKTFLPDSGGTYRPGPTFLTGRRQVQEMQFVNGWMWFATSQGVFKAQIGANGQATNVKDILPQGSIAGGSGHWWRSLCVTSDGFFTSVGDSGNISDLTKTDREKVWKYSLDGKTRELWCSGIRNTEKLSYRPGTTELWGGDQGSDWFGKNIGDHEGQQPITDFNPPDEINHYIKDGFYGHPFVVGFRTPRPEFYNRPDIIDLASKTIVPEWGLPAHCAIDGWCWITKSSNLPNEFKGDMFVGLHGSWNRSRRSGYKVDRILFDKVTGRPYGQQTIVSTMDNHEQVYARPVDCVEAPDGSILFSSDAVDGGKVYRISYIGKH